MTDGTTGLSSMSAATPTLIPRGGHFPALLPPVPSRGEPKPPTFRGRSDGRINTVRDLAREMDDLSDEEAEVEGLNNGITKRGFSWLVPIGRLFTDQEEKNDLEEEEDDDDDTGGDDDGTGSSTDEEAEDDAEADNESMRDLDASIEDLDEQTESISGEMGSMGEDEEEISD